MRKGSTIGEVMVALAIVAVGATVLTGRCLAADLREPWPDDAAVAKAEREVREIFAADISRAKSTADKAALAKGFLTYAEKVGDEPAQRLTLLLLAKSYAIEGRDKKTAMDATQAILERYKPKVEMESQQLVGLGDKSLAAAKREQSTVKKIELQVEALECYLWARQTATGLTRQLCEKRIADLATDGGEKKSGKVSDLKALIGDWKVSKPKNQIGIWTFSADGSVVSDMNKSRTTGRWEASDDVVMIRWENRCWDTFIRPLKAKDQKGDGWDGKGVIAAEKINNRR